MLFTNWLQKVKELAKLSLISNLKPFGIDSERVVSHQKLTNSWVAKVLDWAHTFFVKFQIFKTSLLRYIVLKFSEIANYAMHFQYSGLISWLISYKTVGLCYWDQNCKQRVTCISWSKVHILLNLQTLLQWLKKYRFDFNFLLFMPILSLLASLIEILW